MFNDLLSMILKMSIATLLYVGLTALVFRFWQKKQKTTLLKVGVGLVYGLCSIASNHLSIDYGSMLINVRDIGPLAAGLFFSPLSGILAGLIGGIERYLIGRFMNIGAFTAVACGLSTALAGCLAAALSRWYFRDRRPTVIQGLVIGAMMEVFHMYAVLVTNRDEIAWAYHVVTTCSIPMISFTAVGLGLCTLVVLRMTHDQSLLSQQRNQKALFTLFQRGLMIVIIVLFLFSTQTGYNIQVRISTYNVQTKMQLQLYWILDSYKENGDDMPAILKELGENNNSSEYMTTLIDRQKKTLYWGSGEELIQPLTDEEMALLAAHEEGESFFANFGFLPDIETINVLSPLTDQYYLLCMTGADKVRDTGKTQLYDTILSNILIFGVLYLLVSLLVDRMVVRNLKRVNRSLNRITEGHLDEVVSVRSSAEFSELSDDINQTVAALRGYIDEAERRMEKDLKLAADIQDAALPKNFNLNRSDFSIYAIMDPAKEVGGDFYDYFFVDSNTLAMVIADVSGKSVPAAMFMMRSKTAIKNFARSGNDPGELLTKVNSVLCEGNDAGMFVTVWLGIIDLHTGHMRCANAGHEYPVIKRAGGDYVLMKDKHSLALAAMEGLRVKDYELQLNPGDRVFVYTDGVPEAINEQNEAYGTERLVAKLNTLKDAPEEETLKGVREDTEAFAGKAEQFDDITMLGFTYLGPDRSAIVQDQEGCVPGQMGPQPEGV